MSRSQVRTLPAHPHLDPQKKRAKALARELKERAPAALQRVVAWHPGYVGSRPEDVPALRLADAQLVVAREYGFASWARLKHHIDALGNLELARCHAFDPALESYRERARGLRSVFGSGDWRAIRLVRLFHPRFQDASEQDLRDLHLTQEDAELVLAREHGFEDFAALAAYVERLARGEVEDPFPRAWRQIQAGDVEGLRALLAAVPEVVNARGTNGNRLLGLALGPLRGIETGSDPEIGAGGRARRVELVRALLDAGADPDLPNDKGATALHQVAYGDHEAASQREMLELVDLLLARGASLDAETYGDGGTPLMLALFWGHRPQAERLAGEAIVPCNLRVAAGLGRLDLIRTFFDEAGDLRPEAGRQRGFHRPHSGFPAWAASHDPKEILDEALVYAAKSGRIDAMELLLERGADIEGEPYNGTSLFWAIRAGGEEAARWLLDRGADALRRASFGGVSGLTALHLASAWDGRRAIVRMLLDRDVPVNVRDDVQNATPIGWAEFHGNPDIRADLIEAGSHYDVHVAVLSGRVDRIEALIERDPSLLDLAERGGPTPLDLAIEREDAAVVEWLRARGARRGDDLPD